MVLAMLVCILGIEAHVRRQAEFSGGMNCEMEVALNLRSGPDCCSHRCANNFIRQQGGRCFNIRSLQRSNNVATTALARLEAHRYGSRLKKTAASDAVGL